jgi:archaellum component FlaC
MDATHYDKIADKLIQFNSKLPQQRNLSEDYVKNQVMKIKSLIETMLIQIDELAYLDEMGFVR